MMFDFYEIISRVKKPGRYLGNEINAVHKDLSQIKTKMALIFPDMYELGMSHLGLKILYDIINSHKDAAAERAFAPDFDMEEILRRENVPLFSLESHKPLKEFNIVGFTLPYEMGFSNILNILDLAQIPLKAQERDENWPLIIGGGSCTVNPEPLADFFDLFVLGDGEEVIIELLKTYQNWQDKGASKRELLIDLSKIEGIYVPSLFEVSYTQSETIEKINPLLDGYNSVQRRIVADFDKASYPIKGVTPHLEVTHDRLTMEIARGCTQGCRFCQAGISYRPRRERSPQTIAALIEKSLDATGYEEVSLSSLSSGDYTQLPQLLEYLKKYPEEKLAVSLPSLRAGTLDESLVEYIKKVRQTGFTIAPEAGTERLRRVINKKITEENILQTVELIFSNGWQGIKLYFMIGLPTEEQADLDGIIDLIKKISWTAKKNSSAHVNINVSISVFVPKAGTPFQWCEQPRISDVQKKQYYVKDKCPRSIKLKWHDPYLSYLEGIFSRGDRRLGSVILKAWQNGAKFDQWSEHFNFSLWEKAFSECNIAPDFYLRKRELDEILPWEHLNAGVSKEFLLSEYQRAQNAEITPDCREGSCQNCGLIKICKNIEKNRPQLNFAKEDVENINRCEKKIRFRVKFTKLGNTRFLSHLDLLRLFTRAARRADLPIAYSQGFHPHPCITFSPALQIGVESVSEYADFDLYSYISENDFITSLNRQLPDGIKISDIRQTPLNIMALAQQEYMAAYNIHIPLKAWENESPINDESEKRRVEDFLQMREILITSGAKKKTIDARPLINNFKFASLDESGINLDLILTATNQGSVKPQAVIKDFYKFSDAQTNLLRIKRTCLWLKKGQHFITPMGV